MKLNVLRDSLIEKKKKLYAIALASTLVTTSLTGCGKEKPLLKGTILENCAVTEINGEKTIVRFYSDGTHYHYQDIVSGLVYIKENECSNKRYDTLPQDISFKNITCYLTEEELSKAIQKNLTQEDIIAIVCRVNSENTEEEELEKMKTR